MSFDKMCLGLVCPQEQICAGEQRNSKSRSSVRTESVALARPFFSGGCPCKGRWGFGFSAVKRDQLLHTHRAKEGDTVLQKV